MGESSGMLAPEGDRVWSELRLFVLCIPFPIARSLCQMHRVRD
jgi:hypothetical protein